MQGPAVVTCLALALAACGPRTPGPNKGSAAVPDAAPVVDAAPPPLDRDLPRLAELGVKLFEEIVVVFDRAGEDCSAAAQGLDNLRATYGEVTTANAKVLREGRAMELKLALRTYDDRFEAAAKSIAGSKTMRACAMDGTFARAFDALVGPPP